MIHSNELRIGNYLEYYNPTDDVGWQTTQADWQDIRLCHEQNESFNLENRPIPLTEEWLLKFGLSKENGYPYKFNKGYLKIRNGVFFFKYHDIEVDLPFVHQLQNLNFALTGVELHVS